MENKISQAVILSAGFGTRLKPLTDTMPKVMVSIEGKPILQWHIERLKSFGINEIFINLFYLPEVVREYFGNGERFGVKIIYFLESPEILGTAGGIKDFERFLGEHFFVLYGDVFNLVDYSEMAKAFFKHKDLFAMTVVGDTDHPMDSDLAEVDEDLQFIKVHPKPHKELPSRYKSLRAAAFIFNKRVMGYIPPKKYYELDKQMLPAALAAGEIVYGYEPKAYIKDIGTLARYKEVEEYLKRNHV